MLRRTAPALVIAALLLTTAQPAAAAPRTCKPFSFTTNGTPWRAKAIEVRGVTCRRARRLIREYAQPRSCQLEPRCSVGPYRCRTLAARGSEFRERCTRGARLVAWHGSYRSSR